MPREDARTVSAASAAKFDRLYKFLACAALLFIIAPLIHTFIRPVAGGWAAPAALLGAPAMFGFGYGLQALFGAVTRLKRGDPSRAYEKFVKYINPADASLSFAVCAGAGFAVTSAVSEYMKLRYELGLDRLYDKWSAIPLFAGLTCSALIAMGIIAWFYPYSRIVSVRTSFVYITFIVVDFALNIAFEQPQGFLVICTGLFIFCAAVVMNQSQIVGVINATGTGIVTPRVRFYNLLAVGIFCVLVLAAVPFVLAVLVGFAVLVKAIAFFILRGIFGNEEENIYRDAEVQAAEFGSGVFGGIGDLGGEAAAKGFFTFFAFMLLAAILFFIIIRRINVFKIVFGFINNMFANLMEFLANVLEFNRFSTEKYALSDYRDVESKTDKSAIRVLGESKAPAPRSYRDFKRRLDTLADARARLVFAYAELVRCWGELNIRLSISDTPAEIERKVVAASSETEAEPITRAFEAVKYAERDLLPAESARLIAVMCGQIRRAYDA